ncbi:MAG TPA: 3-deoxy-7-phosphoheptulonate synthase [Clostridiales bacterium]|nr:3-deoxy-7-phosphoheptulonate synthase [Clostridiales bacterium]
MFRIKKEIDSPEKIKKILPVPEDLAKIKQKRDQEVIDIICGRSSKLLLIIGPCSADNESAVLEYVRRLGKLQEQVVEKIFIIPRIYTNKPRTRGEGYKGMLHQPDPNSETDIQEGILSLRRMHINAIKESGLTAADEMLYPDNYAYVDDILTYVSIGARSSENQQHRLVCSGIDLPVGVKNPMNGSLQVLLNSIYAVQIPNEFKYHQYQVQTDGNPYAHAILRGAVDTNGIHVPNYHFEDVIKFSKLYEKTGLKNPAIIIDTNHSNSGKDATQQIRIVHEVMSNKKHSKEFAKYFKGFLIESYLLDGAQDIDGKEFGKSITDPCIGWAKTEKLVLNMAEQL